jgi:hypothetical protein
MDEIGLHCWSQSKFLGEISALQQMLGGEPPERGITI